MKKTWHTPTNPWYSFTPHTLHNPWCSCTAYTHKCTDTFECASIKLVKGMRKNYMSVYSYPEQIMRQAVSTTLLLSLVLSVWATCCFGECVHFKMPLWLYGFVTFFSWLSIFLTCTFSFKHLFALPEVIALTGSSASSPLLFTSLHNHYVRAFLRRAVD